MKVLIKNNVLFSCKFPVINRRNEQVIGHYFVMGMAHSYGLDDKGELHYSYDLFIVNFSRESDLNNTTVYASDMHLSDERLEEEIYKEMVNLFVNE